MLKTISEEDVPMHSLHVKDILKKIYAAASVRSFLFIRLITTEFAENKA